MCRFLFRELPTAPAAFRRLIVRLIVSGSAFVTGTTARREPAGRRTSTLLIRFSHDGAVGCGAVTVTCAVRRSMLDDDFAGSTRGQSKAGGLRGQVLRRLGPLTPDGEQAAFKFGR